MRRSASVSAPGGRPGSTGSPAGRRGRSPRAGRRGRRRSPRDAEAADEDGIGDPEAVGGPHDVARLEVGTAPRGGTACALRGARRCDGDDDVIVVSEVIGEPAAIPRRRRERVASRRAWFSSAGWSRSIITASLAAEWHDFVDADEERVRRPVRHVSANRRKAGSNGVTLAARRSSGEASTQAQSPPDLAPAGGGEDGSRLDRGGLGSRLGRIAPVSSATGAVDEVEHSRLTCPVGAELLRGRR